ncbi:MAG: tetratricopeptide repeat protein [Rubrivivax sp.]|nr:tetratricopeptide repeat protein [Rubrivivax sp.]
MGEPQRPTDAPAGLLREESAADAAQAGTDPDYAQAKALFSELGELPDEAARRARLAELNIGPALAARVLALLGHSEAATTRFSAPVSGMLASAAANELAPGDRLGAWTLLSELGRGGMGRVYLAERSDGHYQQRAAVKLLLGLSSEAALAALAAERQILAHLSHPHIARLIDGGTTPLGRPYLVMEYIEGQRIDRYCLDKALPVEAVLELFAQVCEAVDYAHRQLVVHCDIKPGNIIVGSDGRAMLLDFGIAQLQGRQGVEALALTPQYASPEQLAGQPARSASDIFSLGRTLGELLAGCTPSAPRADEWRAIVAKATATDPEQRYLTAAALRGDMRRFRAHQPLAALPRRGAYLARKFVRRRWPWVLAGSGVLVLSTAFMLRLVQERDRALLAEALARQEAATTRQVSDFMVSLFEGADPNIAARQDLSAAALVDKGRERIDADLKGQGAVQAAMKFVLGKVYENIGRPRTAVELYEQAVALERAQTPRRPLREAAALSRLANALANDYQAARAVAPARESLALRQAHAHADSPEMADSLDTLGWVLTVNGAFDEGAAMLERALAIRQAHEAEAPLALASTLHNLALMHGRAGHLPQAEAQYRRALALKTRWLGGKHPSVLNTLGLLAAVLAQQHRRDEAQALLVELVAQRRALHGPRNSKVSHALNELASVMQDAGRTGQAIATYREALAIDEDVSGHSSTETAIHLNNLATALEDAGDPAAEAAYRESLAIRQALLPAGDLTLARAHHNLGRWLLRAARLAEARPWLEQSDAARQARLPAGHPDRVDSRIALAEGWLASGDAGAAERFLIEPASREAALSPMRRVALWRAQALLAHARHQGAQALRKQQEALALATRTVGPAHPGLQRLRLEVAEAQAAAGDLHAARATLASVKPALATHALPSPLRQRGDRLALRLARS